MHSTANGYSSIFTTNNATIEARLLLSGEEIHVGIPYEAAAGGSFREKRQYLSQLDVDKLAKVVIDTNGFCIELSSREEDNLFVMPSGFIVLSASRGCTTLRWGVASDERDTARVRNMLARVIESFPEYNNSSQPIGKFANFIDKDSEAG